MREIEALALGYIFGLKSVRNKRRTQAQDSQNERWVTGKNKKKYKIEEHEDGSTQVIAGNYGQYEDDKKAIRELVQQRRKDPNFKKTITIKRESKHAQEKAEEIGADITNAIHVITADSIGHTTKGHDKNNEDDGSLEPIDDEEYERIPEILDTPDAIRWGKKKKNEKTERLVYIKLYPDGEFHCIEAHQLDDERGEKSRQKNRPRRFAIRTVYKVRVKDVGKLSKKVDSKYSKEPSKETKNRIEKIKKEKKQIGI